MKRVRFIEYPRDQYDSEEEALAAVEKLIMIMEGDYGSLISLSPWPAGGHYVTTRLLGVFDKAKV